MIKEVKYKKVVDSIHGTRYWNSHLGTRLEHIFDIVSGEISAGCDEDQELDHCYRITLTVEQIR